MKRRQFLWMTGAMTLPFAARAQSGSVVNYSGTVTLVAKDAAVPPGPVPPDPPSVGTIPMSFDDPMFTNMTETTSSYNLQKGQSASHKSIRGPASGDAASTGWGNNNWDYCRCDSREGF